MRRSADTARSRGIGDASDRAVTPHPRVAVVGATGAVGRTMLEILRERAFPAAEIVAFASERSAGQVLAGGLTARALSEEEIGGFDLALFSAGSSVSREIGRAHV